MLPARATYPPPPTFNSINAGRLRCHARHGKGYFMGGTQQSTAPDFHGSISRRLTVLSALFLVLVIIVGGLSVLKARHIGTLHDESEELDSHSQSLDHLQNAISHLRAEAQDALFLGRGRDDPNLRAIPPQIRGEWESFTKMHFAADRPWAKETAAEHALYRRTEERLEHFLALAGSVSAAGSGPAATQNRLAAMLHAETHGLEADLQRIDAAHHAMIAERERAAKADLDFILWTYVAFVILGGMAVAGGSILFVRRMAVPLRRLNAAAEDVAQGAFERRVPVTSRDEIGRLAQTFNRMAEALSERDAQVRRRAQEMEALHRVGTEVSSLLHIDRVITSVVESARGLFGADGAGLALADGPAQEIRWTVFAGGRPEAFKEIRLRPGEGVAGRVVATGSPVMVEDALGDLPLRPEAYPILSAEGLRGALAVPLRRGDRVLGALMVAYRAPRRFAESEVVLLSSFANQVAVAMDNAELYGQVHALQRVGMEISSLLDPERILQTVVTSARAVLRTDAAAICLLRDGGPHLDVQAVAGPWEEIMGPRPADCCSDLAGDGNACLRCHEGHAARNVAHLSAPLRRGDQVLGALCVGSAPPRTFGEAERNLLGGLAAQAAIAIENARLVEATRGVAAVEERERLAREMHDGLAQALGFLNLKLALAEQTLDGAPAGPTRLALAEMRKVAGDAYEEVRQAIFGLRTMVSRGLGLIPTLSEYLHEFSQSTGLDVKLEAREEDGPARLAPEVEVQLIRIVQEALHNVRKHAGARSAWVRFWREDEDLLMAIEDNGTGFDPGASPGDGRRHYGLATMRERAESVGGALALRSAAGMGTQVVVRLPLSTARRGANVTAGRRGRWSASG
ncbi:MAG TPA: GAF domain-containing protein [Candidatus Sulfotelmatobacter sp.]|nr:GAF domain-containing protein [Candidatus Sulfotelmatobacter sp.]